MRLKIVSEIRLLSAARTKESLDISKLDRIFSAAGRRSNAFLKIRFSAACRRLSAAFRPFAGNPNRQPEIQKIRWKSVKVAELFCSCVKFQIFS